eukprot:CAMPEP_0206190154 /NCGR_PEP_ID=MMETSP0166-20121206/4584_1 /ASSEMBLY_ACC=CAM_ASM_000260 /TAXON_ID=95228 /ORGANISM="Vannella robusta, Strain DIVA3 518/3/11/1/6" /LENGTH=387 /DNA_ID=CAMNT_0053606185 /DNA_START=363 /DNA_END=1526 /DNA_ORIENTATION=-
MEKFVGVEHALEEISDENLRRETYRVLYGVSSPHETLDVPQEVVAMSEQNQFEVKGFKLPCAKEQMRAPRIVRVAVIQNSIARPTTDSLEEQYTAIENKIEKMIDAAALMGANIVCLQEAWTGAFFFCTRERYPWSELAEDPENGRSTQFIKGMAKKYNMVIISPILERDEEHGETIWNTAVVVGNNGNYIGKHRKNHIPRVGDFNESTYYMEGDDGHPVFNTQFGKIAINICYGRHHPFNWAMFGLNGAEMVFNPSATVGALSEPLWGIEARNAAIANSYFTFAINRVGTETFANEFTSGDGKPAHKDFGHFYGSSYCASPDGSRTPALSRTQDGVLVTEIDLNLRRQVKDKWGFSMTSRLPLYGESYTNASKPDFKRQIINDPLV